ncbi:MAG: nuclear transport factor 2 family protein [Mycobacterium sp.]|uniref:nuclear transport factor 2 family protein n=2 Tax=Mycobacterium sp. TaxID=1785 RepID=UPI003F9AFEE0
MFAAHLTGCREEQAMTTEDTSAATDERAIEQALIRFARGMDEHDWAALAAILAADAVGDVGDGPLKGAMAIIDRIRRYLERCGPTQHLLGNILVDITGDTAQSRAYVHDVHLSVQEPTLVFYTLGDYHDRWERRAGQWRLVERIKRNRGAVGSLEVFRT